MRNILVIVLLLASVAALAQTDEVKLTGTLKAFHQDLVKKNTVSINQQTDKALSYGHSNGWVENKTELMEHLKNGVISYNSFAEDSISVVVNGTLAHARFIADIKATMNGVDYTFSLRVLEVWVKKGNRWLLFARQAVRK